MRRRDVLLGAGSLGLSVEAAASEGTDLTPDEIEQAVKRLSRQLHTAERGDFTTRHKMRTTARGAGMDTEGDALERLTRSTMRTLLVADLVSDVSKDNRRHPKIEGLLEDNGAEMDYAYLGSVKWLSALDEDTTRSFKTTLRDQPELLDTVAADIDAMAAEAGINRRKRERLRELVGHVGWKLRNQGAGMIIDEVLDQQVRMIETAKRQAVPTKLAAGSVARWSRELDELHGLLEPHVAGTADEAPVLPAPPGLSAFQSTNEPGTADERPSPRSARVVQVLTYEELAHKRRKRARAFAISGLITGLVGGLMIAAGAGLADAGGAGLVIAGLFPITGFVVLMILALITVAMAASAQSKANKQARDELQ